ncbi:hypothetical protein H7F15_00105 [Pontibacter sp. Tf4]|uniref:hypothetical protein n=1 Tax=Pontibacter sp. Tf4 TaxID=2761620 RepID=UPI00162430FC|nr:hypothetical protein [Pontibacter sp. Tf4]MBB6609427.1 hypothetical protein [Pontibacter sp. Tf4]
MKQTNLLWLCLALLLFSCSKDAENIAPAAQDNSLISNAMEHFNTSVLTGTAVEAQTQSANSNNYRHNIIKNAEWSNAKTVQLSIGEAVQVPLSFSKELYAQVKNSPNKLALSSLSYLLMYRNTRGWQTEVVHRLPDAAYLANTAINKSFTGMVLVENWQGNFIRGYSYDGNGTVKKLLAPRVKGSSSETQVMYEMPSYECNKEIDWYTCSSWECHYSYTETICSWTGGESGGGDYSGGSNDDGGGHHDGDYGDGNDSGYPSSDDYSDAPLEPRKVEVAVIPHTTITYNPIASCIYGKLGPGNHAYDKFLVEFQEDSEYTVIFKLQDNLTDYRGYPANGTTNYTIGSTSITILINSSRLDRPSWEVAGTFVHEMAHAYLAQKLVSIGGPGNLKQYAENTNFTDLFDYYSKYVKIIDNKHVYSPEENSSAQHNLMADKLITDIAIGIRDYVEANTPEIKNHSEITLEQYKAVAWNGLRETGAYTSLSTEEQTEIGINTTILQSFTVDRCI